MWKRLNKEKLTADLSSVLSRGIKSLAVVLLHSYTFPDHEEEVGTLAREMGFTHVSLSSHVMPMVRIVPRGYTGKRMIIIVANNTRLSVTALAINIQGCFQ